MNFQKFVHRSTKGIMLFIAIIMIVPLVLWGYMGRMGPDTGADEVAGTITTPAGPLKITKGTFDQQKQRAIPSYYLKLFRQVPQYAAAVVFRGQRLPETKPKEIADLTWRNIVLLKDADEKGIPLATEEERKAKAREMMGAFFFGRLQLTSDNEEALARQLFGCTQPVFVAWLDDLVRIDKLLEMMSGAEFAEYVKVYDRVMGDQQSLRVTFAGFDPKEYVKELKPPRTDEIAKYYQDNKIKFRSPEKVVISYLIADYDEFKKNEPEPAEDAIKKYYDDHLAEFLKPAPEHKHGPGEEHKEDEKIAPQERKSLDEVRGEIPDKIKRRGAEDKASDLMKGINQELGEAFVKNNNAYPENILDDVRKKYEEKGVKLVRDVTTPFDRRRVEDIEKIVGTGGGLESWAFDSKRAKGDISNIVSTSKGKAFFKVEQKKAADDNPGVSVQNREAIVKELQKEQLKKRAQQQASTVADEIKNHGIADARLKVPLDWRSTRYFKSQFNRGDPASDDPGIEDRSLGSAIRSHVAQSRLKAGQASVLQGSSVGGEKRDWSFVVYVDDVVASPPADFEAKFQEARREMDYFAREKYQQQYGDNLVLHANIDKNKKLKDNDGAGAPVTPTSNFPDDEGP